MTPYEKRLTKMTRRMADDMKIRNLARATIDTYTYQVGKFAEFLGKDLARATPEDVRSFQLHMIEVLRIYWREYRPAQYLFPGKTPDRPYAQTSIQKAIKAAAVRARITKRVTPHVLRHSYATGLLEAGVDILTISRLLGHTSFVTTMVYLHVRQPHLQSTPSPLDWLPVRQLPGWQQAGMNNHQQPQPPSKNRTRETS